METEAHAWNPGLESDIPARLWPLVTLFRAENAYISHAEAKELADLTGLKVLELVALRPERLLIHSLLVRVTAELSVPDGPAYAELGINLRAMVRRILDEHMRIHLDGLTAVLESERDKALAYVLQQLSEKFSSVPAEDTELASQPSLLMRWFGKRPVTQSTSSVDTNVEVRALELWKQQLDGVDEPLQRACLSALIKTVGTVTGHRGRMLPDHSLVARIVVNQVGNSFGAELVDEYTQAFWWQAVEAEGYRVLPAQAQPVVMNVKGASASGKSTIRPQQRALAEKLGIPWDDFALISPDYWRKFLLDYPSLGEDHKYGAMLTGRELEIIDKKLDRYMAAKAENGALSHLLIDRFRFDSFVVDRPADSNLLSRFGERVFLFFMVTHPAETVSRAFERGKKTGRYKAVDDLLHHNVEAFTGMPSLFLSWVNLQGKRIHFEFLDNDVPEGELPRTVAFGHNETLVILDVKLLLNIDRYRKVDITATQPEEIFKEADLVASANTDFIVQCAKTVKTIVFADAQTSQEYATLVNGEWAWWDAQYIEAHADDEGLMDILTALGYGGQHCTAPAADVQRHFDIATEQQVTVGRWHLQ